ncbi:hypothetical protein [Bradyrhizobium septentrionale]|uniref:Uncharacterized protein n=1 Tax=Bradyrhizobium septentrionale TaxID=1404411 RepID=A0ABZ2NNX1_9BRAD
MAKDRDNLAADFDTESTTGFLAEEEALDRRMLWRLGSWGVAAVGAVIVAVLANQSALTLKRDQLAASDIARQAQQLQTLAKESHNETRRLASRSIRSTATATGSIHASPAWNRASTP